MKDAYSFHTSQEDLEKQYYRVYDAYFNIYKRLGLKNVISVASDTGMMGGKVAHEFMLLSDMGEDSIAICDCCDYRANVEVAKGVLDKVFREREELKEVYTGDAKSIDEVCELLNIKNTQTCKAVCYCIEGESDKILALFVRGDLEVNEAKVKALIGKNIAPYEIKDETLVAGNIGPLNLNNDNIICMFDNSLKDENNLVCGANKEGYHYCGVCLERDLKNVEYNDISKVKDGEGCAVCGNGKIFIKRGVEIGNIFQLGTKYTQSMNMTVQMPDSKEINPIMGCYGIGIGRNLACIAEESSDEKGLVWNMNVCPWEVVVCPLKLKDEKVLNYAENLYEQLKAKHIDVLIDDRDVSAGCKFIDSELMGIPLRVVVSPRSLENNQVELCIRETGEKVFVSVDEVVEYLQNYISSKKF